MNTPDSEIKNISSEMLPQGALPVGIIETQSYRGMNRFLLLIIAASVIPWLFGGYEIFGFKITGWTWVLPLVLAGLVCMANIRRISFPLRFWLFWMGLLCLYWFFGSRNLDAHQSLLQMLSPIVVGCAASIFRPNNWQLENVIRWMTRLAWLALAILLIRWPIILSGALPGHGFMAAEMIGLLLLGACYATFYACGSGRHLYYYLAMLAITVISLTRGPMVAMFSCLPLTLAPLATRKRILLSAMLLIFALILFNTARVQERMFYSGEGKVGDLYWENPDLQTSGRTAMWEIVWGGVVAQPWLGNGWNSHREALLSSGSALYLPHNDWLKLLHDMGIIGAGIYLFTILWQMFNLARIARWSSGAHQMLAYGAATAFIPYALVMFTDNVVLYVQFFGNLHFALIGIVYGTLRNETVDIKEGVYQREQLAAQ
jgi:hypothetical protein